MKNETPLTRRIELASVRGETAREYLRREWLLTNGTGAYSSVPEVCAAVIREVDAIQPRDPSYASRYQTYRDLYPALKPLFSRM